MRLLEAAGWALLGAGAGYLVGWLCLKLEAGIGPMEEWERSGRSWIESLLLPGLGLLGFFMFFAR